MICGSDMFIKSDYGVELVCRHAWVSKCELYCCDFFWG